MVAGRASWRAHLVTEGVELQRVAAGTQQAGLLSAFLTQLIDEGLAVVRDIDPDRAVVTIGWSELFRALEGEGYQGLDTALDLPAPTSLRPVLTSHGSLSDSSFAIRIAGWRAYDGGICYPAETGAVLDHHGRRELMTREHWALAQAVRTFAQRSTDQRSSEHHRRQWAGIRKLAVAAGAVLDKFLKETVVLTPETVNLALRHSDAIRDDVVIEVIPGFDEVPQDWLRHFDKYRVVLDRYDVPTESGLVQVMVPEAVKTVLEEIKCMPNRRVAGPRSDALILNPYAALGLTDTNAINEAQFQQARVDAGLTLERFRPVRRADSPSVGLEVTPSMDVGGPGQQTETLWLTETRLRGFVQRLEGAIRRKRRLLAWEGYQFELDDDASVHLATLKLWQTIPLGVDVVISHDRVYDISSYAPRVYGIGVEEPLYSAHIAKKDSEQGWFPENLQPLISFRPAGADQPVMIPASPERLDTLRQQLSRAESDGRSHVTVEGLPEPVTLAEARGLLEAFEAVRGRAADGTFDPSEPVSDAERGPSRPKRVTLLLRQNIETLDYEEQRRRLRDAPQRVEVPDAATIGPPLKPHQRDGLAWLQHLYRLRRSCEVRGALLADDMGLGKTYQLLAFMAWVVEHQPDVEPMLVVAPVALLENWRMEAEKFIRKDVLRLLVAYGRNLKSLRVSQTQIDRQLRDDDGLSRFLRPDWVGNANVVLTTYETLRDLEFSFAAQKWSVMVCDEAQKIKTPSALVTRAAKKQHVDFRIACTGTPVENTLADLWSLFDFIQPGLLGTLSQFGREYRRPIEASTPEQKAQVDTLRRLIDPQTLRRMKSKVARDLPERRIDEACRSLQLSQEQRRLYANAINGYRQGISGGGTKDLTNHLSLLHYLRLLCAHPSEPGCPNFNPGESLQAYRTKSPKLHWLIEQLERIRERQEKVIVFCEFREIQRLLKHYIEVAFPELDVDIINGETTAAADDSNSRQKRLERWQNQKGFGVVVLSPLAVGFGVNIQKANHVVHYTRTWNPAKEDQATDRAYRIGQTRDVYVYYPTVCAPDFVTFEQRLDTLLSGKRALADDMLNGAADISGQDFKVQEIAPSDYVDVQPTCVGRHELQTIGPRPLEGLVAALWERQSYDTCYCTPKSGDHGVDVVAFSGDEGVLIQVKSSSEHRAQLGWDAVKDVVAGRAHYERLHPRVTFRLIGVTNQQFNSTAREQARLNHVELIDMDGLAERLERFPITMDDVRRMIG